MILMPPFPLSRFKTVRRAVYLESVAAQWRKAGDGAGRRRGCEVGNMRLDAVLRERGEGVDRCG